MGTLVSYASNEGAIRGIGVFILEVPPPGTVQSGAQNVVGLVGEFGWGPEAAYEPTSSTDLRDAMFGPCGQGYAAWQSLYGKRFGRVICSRVLGTDAAAASVTIEDAATSGTASLKATARYKGAKGNNITITVATVGGAADVTVSFARADGSLYSASYEAVQSANGNVTDPGDPYVLFEKASGATADAYAGTYTLGQTVADPIDASTVGTDGTINAAAYTTALARLGGVSSPVAIVCPVAPTSAISTADVNGSLFTFAGSNPDKIVLLRTAASESVSSAISDVASYSAENVVKLWSRVYQRLPGTDGNLAKTLTDGGPFLASILANTDPWISPGSKEGTRYTGEILDLEDTSISAEAYANLVEAGVAPWFMSSKNGAMIRGAVCTDGTRIRARRYKTFIQKSIAFYLEDYVDSPLDLNVAGKVLGPNTSGQVGAIRQFLESERIVSHLIAYDIDPFEAMDSTKFAAGRWDIVVRVTDVPGAEQIVIRHQQGPSVSID